MGNFFFPEQNPLSRVFALEVLGLGCMEKQDTPESQVCGRILSTYAFVYVVDGAGFFEAPDCPRRTIFPGDWIFLMPQVPHSYGPNTGGYWKEYWVIFDGPIARDLQKFGLISPSKPIFRPGLDLGLMRQLEACLARASEDDASLWSDLTGGVYQCLTKVVSQPALSDRPPPPLEKAIAELVHQINQNPGGQVFDFQKACRPFPFSYSTLRREFRRVTGESPQRYYDQQRCRMVRKFLVETDLSLKELAYSMGFHDPHYFSRWFKKQMSVAPETYRAEMRRWVPPGSK